MNATRIRVLNISRSFRSLALPRCDALDRMRKMEFHLSTSITLKSSLAYPMIHFFHGAKFFSSLLPSMYYKRGLQPYCTYILHSRFSCPTLLEIILDPNLWILSSRSYPIFLFLPFSLASGFPGRGDQLEVGAHRPGER